LNSITILDYDLRSTRVLDAPAVFSATAGVPGRAADPAATTGAQWRQARACPWRITDGWGTGFSVNIASLSFFGLIAGPIVGAKQPF